MESFIHQLYEYVKWQNQEIMQMKNKIAALSDEVKGLKEKPAITVEKLEYKFDQLKVETLEGTLNIGLNPSDLKEIDDLSVSQSPLVQPNDHGTPELRHMLQEKINLFMTDELENYIHDTVKETGIKLDSHYINLIQQDIHKQLPARIEHYLHYFTTRPNQNYSEEELIEQIYKKMIADIHNGVRTFIHQLPINRQEGNQTDGT